MTISIRAVCSGSWPDRWPIRAPRSSRWRAPSRRAWACCAMSVRCARVTWCWPTVPKLLPAAANARPVLGPGVAPDDSDQTMSITRIIDSCADDGTPCVVDAGGLEFVPGHVEENIVLTPHAGELVRLLEERGEKVEIETVREDPGHWALQAAELTGATVLLKGNTTLVARPGGTVITQVSAPSTRPW